MSMKACFMGLGYIGLIVSTSKCGIVSKMNNYIGVIPLR